MIDQPDETLGEAITQLLPAFIGVERWPALERRLSLLPEAGMSLLEVRLAERRTQCDYSQLFLPDTRSDLWRHIQACHPGSEPWKRIAGLIRTWESHEAYLDAVWLEYDFVDGNAAEIRAPSVFVSVGTSQFSSLADARLNILLADLFRNMLGGEVYEQYLNRFLQFVKNFTTRASSRYVGFMLSREPVAIRAQIQSLTTDDVRSWLAVARGDQDNSGVLRALDIVDRFFGFVVLCVDITVDGVQPRIGFELFAGDEAQEMPLKAFADHLVQENLCAANKRDAIVNWSKTVNPTAQSTNWPDSRIVQSLQKRPNWLSYVNRRVNHFKFICEPEKEIEAKAYLAWDEWVVYPRNPRPDSRIASPTA